MGAMEQPRAQWSAALNSVGIPSPSRPSMFLRVHCVDVVKALTTAASRAPEKAYPGADLDELSAFPFRAQASRSSSLTACPSTQRFRTRFCAAPSSCDNPGSFTHSRSIVNVGSNSRALRPHYRAQQVPGIVRGFIVVAAVGHQMHNLTSSSSGARAGCCSRWNARLAGCRPSPAFIGRPSRNSSAWIWATVRSRPSAIPFRPSAQHEPPPHGVSAAASGSA